MKALKMILILVSIQGKKEEEMVDTSKTEQGQLIVLHIASAWFLVLYPHISLKDCIPGRDVVTVVPLELHDCKKYLRVSCSVSGTLLILSLMKLICPHLWVFHSLAYVICHMGIWQRIFALSPILFSHKSYESNNDVLGRTETMMVVISKVENILHPSAPDTCAFVLWS